MDGRRWGLLRVVAVLLLIGLVSGVAYTLGIANGTASVATSVGGTPGTVPVVYAPWHYGAGFGFGFGGFFGILFVIVLVALLVRVVAGPRRWGGTGGRSGYGAGRGWNGPDGDGARDVPPGFQPMFESWHRRAHGDQPSAGGSGTDASHPGG